MELKVWVEGIQRIVCGVTVNTTCQDVVFALAHATGKVGRFTLIERWRNNERLLAPTENPLKLLLKWGEYANDVQFILQRSEQTKRPAPATTTVEKGHSQQFGSTNATKKQPLASNVNDSDLNLQQPMQQQQSIHAATEFMPLNRCKELRKSFGSSESSKPIENVGIVKGVPQRTSAATSSQPSPTSLQKSAKHEKTPSNLSLPSSTSTSETLANYFETNSTNEINLAEVRNALDRRTSPPTTQMNYSPHQTESNNNISNSSENLIDAFNGNTSSSNISNNNNNNAKYQAISNSVSPDLYKNTPLISSNGALVPPPYRDPPPPRNSPMQLQLQQQTQAKLMEFSTGVGGGSNFNKKTDGACSNPFLSDMGDADFNDNFFEAAQYKDLIQLIKFQREKITSQQTELTKYDAEIVYLENKERDQAQELEAISREITKADQIFRQGTEQTLQYVEEENELVKQQEKTLKSEITLLRSKLANCETELLQCKNKIRILMDDIQVEQRAISNRQKDNRQNVERDFLIEMERIQTEIDQAIHNTDSSSKATDNLKKEINMIENAIAEKKRQVEQLVNEMKEVNLQSLAVTPSDEIRNLLEGSNKPGSSRRIIGSPRQLENAVPTSKNPHGVWV